MKNELTTSLSSASKFNEWKLFQTSLHQVKDSRQALIKTGGQPSLLIQHLSAQFSK